MWKVVEQFEGQSIENLISTYFVFRRLAVLQMWALI